MPKSKKVVVKAKRGKSNIELTPKQVIAELREDVRDLNAERKVMIEKLAKCETLADQIFDQLYDLQDANQELRDVIEGFY